MRLECIFLYCQCAECREMEQKHIHFFIDCGSIQEPTIFLKIFDFIRIQNIESWFWSIRVLCVRQCNNHRLNSTCQTDSLSNLHIHSMTCRSSYGNNVTLTTKVNNSWEGNTNWQVNGPFHFMQIIIIRYK